LKSKGTNDREMHKSPSPQLPVTSNSYGGTVNVGPTIIGNTLPIELIIKLET